jgi:uncharacterized protein (DUF362 family)
MLWIETLRTSCVALAGHKDDLEATLRKAIDLVDGFALLRSPVILKPNICADYDLTGFAVTDAKVVEALINLVLKKDKNLSVKIVESDSGSKLADKAFKIFGYKDLEDRMRDLGFDVSLINLSKLSTTKIVLEGLHFKEIELPRMILNPKFLISLAVAKTHFLSGITGVSKNLSD